MCPICKVNELKINRKYCGRPCYIIASIGRSRPDVSIRNKINNPMNSEESLHRMRSSLTGRKQSDDTKRKRSDRLIDFYKNNPKPLGWPSLRSIVSDRDNGVCAICSLTANKPFVVHKVSYRGESQIGRTLIDKNPDNYVTCCHACYNKKHKFNGKGYLNSADDRIFLKDGIYALIDKEDFRNLSRYNWYLQDGYAATYSNGDTIKMHRMISNASGGEYVDHINRNRLDNRRNNLRLATHSQNQANSSFRKNSKTKLKGVTKVRNKYRAIINKKHIGYFDTPQKAAKAYDNKAKQLFGEFAYLNFPD